MRALIHLAVCAWLAMQLTGCKTVGPYDYSNYRAHRPRSILVLPPLNESTVTQATYSYLSTVTQPLAEMGYYVFPVAVVDEFLKENGLPSAGEMHHVSPSKIAEITGADAVLFITVQQYGSKYQLINTKTVVEVQAKMLDTRTETVLWEGHGKAEHNSGNFDDLVGNLIAAAVQQIANSKTDPAHQVSRQANADLFNGRKTGLLYGPYSPKYDGSP